MSTATVPSSAVGSTEDKVDVPPPGTRFRLGTTITPEQQRCLDVHGVLHFSGVAHSDEVAMLTREQDRITSMFEASGRKNVNGVPVFYGRDLHGRPLAQRLPFTTQFSREIRAFIHDERFEPIRRMVDQDARIGDEEKDGVVMNRYVNIPGSVYPRLGWHTDGLRDLFYGRLPVRMLNIGLHLDRVTREDGGLRLIPGSHHQGFLSMAMGKPYFIWHRPDPREICIETEPGDLTIHDGRLWHRVARSAHQGDRSIRRTMFVPYLTGPREPKHADSPTPGYHRLGALARTIRNARPRRR